MLLNPRPLIAEFLQNNSKILINQMFHQIDIANIIDIVNINDPFNKWS